MQSGRFYVFAEQVMENLRYPLRTVVLTLPLPVPQLYGLFSKHVQRCGAHREYKWFNIALKNQNGSIQHYI